VTAKEIVQEVLAQLPDDCSLEDIEYHVYVRRQLQEAEEEIERGDLVDHAEVARSVHTRWPVS
jgi:uncharacterized protein with PhoU and TrkA domain